MVRMCSGSFALIRSIMAARVVDLPEPVTPVTRTRPRGLSQRVWTMGGRPSASKLRISPGMVRKTPGGGALLVEDIGPEAGHALEAEGEVHLEVLLQPVLLLIGHDAIAQPAGLGRIQGRELEGHHAPVDADLGGRFGGDVQVGAPILHHRLEELLQRGDVLAPDFAMGALLWI